ncbi:MAG: 4-hydroxythreonine-4-phosphate dehydrogenase PdxA, partial [Sinomicrobium sp.]|nr:4-hydroxythreonine-4-phosphate dehydrogenase PdxA [Sinomicrobium sp.]
MKTDQKIRAGISAGDLNGIGMEIILKTFQDSRMLDFCTPVIFASTKTVAQQCKHFNIAMNYTGIEHASQSVPGKINIVNVWKKQPHIAFGQATEESGKYAFYSLKAAADALKKQQIDVLVTAPVNKHNMQSKEFEYPGHTQYLAAVLGGKALMFMISEEVKVGLLTDHIPVKAIADHIDAALVAEKIQLMYTSLQTDFRIRKPRIAVLGINPHSGDGGLIGKEDDELLKPVIQKMNDSGKLVYGSYAADGFFGSGNYRNFDGIIAAYHDQGLVPFKTLTFGNGVNYTAGLPEIRTSPDHGTAYDIAGKDMADFQSFKEAVFWAVKIF